MYLKFNETIVVAILVREMLTEKRSSLNSLIFSLFFGSFTAAAQSDILRSSAYYYYLYGN